MVDLHQRMRQLKILNACRGHPQVLLLLKLSSRTCSWRSVQSSLTRSHTFPTPRTYVEFSRLEIFSPVAMGVVPVLHPIFTPI